jgi:uncharacterized protein (TIGR02266 family)
MKRLLVAARERALTRFFADALATEAPGQWEVARAHTHVEAWVLASRGPRPFSLAALDLGLGEGAVLDLVGRLRAAPETSHIRVVLITERGRDRHLRSAAASRLGVSGFMEHPLEARGLAASLAAFERQQRIWLVESDPTQTARLRHALAAAGYRVETFAAGKDVLARMSREIPELAVSAVTLEDGTGLELCARIRQRTRAVPVLLYGPPTALPASSAFENRHRADDFLAAPFADRLLVERVAALVGTSQGSPPAQQPPRMPSQLPRLTMETPSTGIAHPLASSGMQRERTDPRLAPSLPQRSTDLPIERSRPATPGRRATRRVPCHLTATVQSDGRVFRSPTLDISGGGIFLGPGTRLDVGTLLDLSFQLPGTEEPIRAVAVVAWSSPDAPGQPAHGVGLKFTRIDPADLARVVDYVNRLAAVVYEP